MTWLEREVGTYRSGAESSHLAARLSLRSVFREIHNGRNVEKVTAAYRKRLAARPAGMDPVDAELWDAELSAWKSAHVAAWTPAGVFEGSRKFSPLPNYSGVIAIDVDHVEDAPALRVRLAELPEVAYSAVSIGGSGVYCGILLSREPWGLREYRSVWRYVDAWFRESTGLATDPSCKDPTRLRFFANDPDAFVREAPRPLEIPKPAAVRRRADDLVAIEKAEADAARHSAKASQTVTNPPPEPRPRPERTETGSGGDSDGPVGVDTVRAWLTQSTLDPDARNDWLAVGMGLRGLALAGHVTDEDAFALWDEWSRRSSKYGGLEEAWKSFNRPAYTWGCLMPKWDGPAPVQAAVGDGGGSFDALLDGQPESAPEPPVPTHRVVKWSVDMGRPVTWGAAAHARLHVVGSSPDGETLVDLTRFVDLTSMDTSRKLISEAMLPVLSSGKMAHDIDTINRRSLAEILQPLQMRADTAPAVLDLRERVDDVEESYSVCGLEAPVDGATILFGAGGVAKSQIAVNTAVRIAGDGGRVVLIDTEPFGLRRKRATVQRHLDALADEQRARAVEHLTLLSARSFGHAAVDALREHCEGAALVVIDSATACVEDDISSSTSAARFFAFLRELGSTTSLLVAHTAKGSVRAKARDSSPLGSQTWESNSRLTIKVSQQDSDGIDERVRKAVLEVAKSNTPAMVGMKSTVTIRFDGAVKVQWLVEGAQTKREKDAGDKAAVIERVVRALRVLPGPVKTAELQHDAGVSHRWWQVVKDDLLQHPDVRTSKKGPAVMWEYAGAVKSAEEVLG